MDDLFELLAYSRDCKDLELGAEGTHYGVVHRYSGSKREGFSTCGEAVEKWAKKEADAISVGPKGDGWFWVTALRGVLVRSRSERSRRIPSAFHLANPDSY